MNFKPLNTPTLIPYLVVKDVDVAVDFYMKAFNFKLMSELIKENDITVHAELIHEDAFIMVGREGGWGMKNLSPKSSGVLPACNIYLYCKNVDEFYEHAIKNGAISNMSPQDQFWGDRSCKITDQDGYEWGFATFLGAKSA